MAARADDVLSLGKRYRPRRLESSPTTYSLRGRHPGRVRRHRGAAGPCGGRGPLRQASASAPRRGTFRRRSRPTALSEPCRTHLRPGHGNGYLGHPNGCGRPIVPDTAALPVPTPPPSPTCHRTKILSPNSITAPSADTKDDAVPALHQHAAPSSPRRHPSSAPALHQNDAAPPSSGIVKV